MTARDATPPGRPAVAGTAPVEQEDAEWGLLGRSVEIAVIAEAIAGVRRQGASVVLRGEAGVGKSSLLDVARRIAECEGLRVLGASGVQGGSRVPFAGLQQLLRPLLGRTGDLPVVQERALLAAFGTRQGPPAQIFLIALASMTLILRSAAACPVVLVVDDVQWLDSPSKDVLAFLSRRVADDPVVLFSGVRDEGVFDPQAPVGRELVVTGLDDRSSRAIVERIGVDLSPSERQEILECARGNPLALVELPVAFRSAAPGLRTPATALALSARLERAFAARIGELPARTRDALLVAAVDAEDSLAEVLAATAELTGAPLSTESLEPAERAGLISFTPSSVRFRHPLVRSGVLAREPQFRTRSAHAALSRVLTGQPFRSVWHRAHSVDAPADDVADLLDASHVESLRRGSVVTAVAGLERAAQLTSDSRLRGQRLIQAAQYAYGLGRGALVNRLVDAAEGNDLTEVDRARVEWLRQMFDETDLGNSDRILELSRHASRAARSGNVDVALDLLLTAGLRAWWGDTRPEARDHVLGVAEGLEDARDDPRRIAAIAMTRPLAEGRQVIDRLEAIRPGSMADASQLAHLGMAARAVGSEVLAADYLSAAESRFREHGQLGLLPQVLAVEAAVRADLGDWRQAAHHLEESSRLAAETGQPTWGRGAVAVEAVFSALTGDVDKAWRTADEIEAACPERVQRDFLCLAQLARGIAHLSNLDPDSAYRALEPTFDPSDVRHHPREHLSGLMFFAEAAAASGHIQRGRRILARMRDLSRLTPSPILAVHLLYAEAVLADDRDAEALFDIALQADLARWPWPRARIQLAFGTWLRQHRRGAEAREPLRSALATFELVGAPGWSQQARAGLRAAGDRNAATGASLPTEPLTAQETQIARLAAEGLSNRAIGEQLYLSPRTVGSHLYRIFPKLGITSRLQLADRLRDAANG